ncbi:MAG: hypothetical protein EZS28_029383 [Streblomastix strix]|uniref:Major facilitator superfamily (MFS) profile domain-containing protein n=1 Tax=Streblomastix strix TaxID=222440 RepID=A0A5J4UZ17_9EUKA|nr:MAG: hypothetical protein EZS28_029383 [Streblomastix strix]
MFQIAKTPHYYAVVLSSVLNMCMVNFLASVFTSQVPQETARTFTGYAFAMAGVMQIVGSFTWGVVIDKKSKRASFFISALLIQLFIIFANTTLYIEFESTSRLVMFCLTFVVYGSVGSSNDINQFWLTWDTCNHNPVIFVQYARLLGGVSAGILSFTSAAGAPYPQYYIILMIAIGILYIVGVWNLDVHYAKMSKYTKKDEDEEKQKDFEGEQTKTRKKKGKKKKKTKKGIIQNQEYQSCQNKNAEEGRIEQEQKVQDKEKDINSENEENQINDDENSQIVQK